MAVDKYETSDLDNILLMITTRGLCRYVHLDALYQA